MMMKASTLATTSAVSRIVVNNRKLTTTAELLTTPGRVAQSLEWKRRTGSVLNMRIAKDRIELAVASHPSFQEPFLELSSISLASKTRSEQRSTIKDSVSGLISKTISKHNVCGIVVDWPVQKEGWCGEACGRVLNVLDQLTANETNVFVNATGAAVPICLYDPNHSMVYQDSWGRNPVYARLPVSSKTLHIASQEQYGLAITPTDENGQALSNVWNNFCEKHIPDAVCRYNKNQIAFYQATIRNSKRSLIPERPTSNRKGTVVSIPRINDSSIGFEQKATITPRSQDADFF
jgi:hypothetical protein